MTEQIEIFEPVVYSCKHPEMTLQVAPGKDFKFHKGRFECNTEEDAAMMEQFLAQAGGAIRAKIFKIDINAAVQAVHAHQQAMAIAGAVTSQDTPKSSQTLQAEMKAAGVDLNSEAAQVALIANAPTEALPTGVESDDLAMRTEAVPPPPTPAIEDAAKPPSVFKFAGK